MLKVKAGDLSKLGPLFERYHKRLFRFFYRLTKRRDHSEDLVQGVFERIIKYRSSYTGDGLFQTWIFQVARNLHADYYRKHSTIPKQDNFPEWEKLEGDDFDPHPNENGTDLELLHTAIDRLDPQKKETLLLSRFEGFRYKEIATIMDCSESAVKVRIYRALKELKVIVEDLSKQKKL